MKISQYYAESIRQPITGCMKDYTGQVNSMLTMLYPTSERISGAGVKWVAMCECGSLALCIPSNKGAQSCGCHRSAVSSGIGKSKRVLTDEQAELIKSGVKTPKQLAYEMNVSLPTISSIKNGRRYQHIT